MYFFINFLATYLIFIFPLIAGYYFFIKKDYALIFQMLLGVLAVKIIEILIKTQYYIPRPYIVNHLAALVTIAPTDSSFPSLHTMISFALATVIFLKNKRLGLILLFVAGLIGTARVLANVHYPIDVISGLIIGVTIGVLCGKIRFYARHHYSSSRSKKSRR